MAELTERKHGPEVWAKRDGTCRFCNEPIAAGEDVIVVVDKLGACHAHCGKGYCKAVNEHLEDAA